MVPVMASSQPIPFDNSYARLPDRFYARLDPTPVSRPRLLRFNDALAKQLGIDAGELAARAEVFAGNRVPGGAEPLAQAYAGHQFGNFVPQLGDGRAILLGEVIDAEGRRRDIQLKGSGRTPFSRGGDGRAQIGPVLREYLVSEAMHALGVPTTRALAAVTTGEPVIREKGPLPGAVLTRVAASHIRVGTFEYFAVRGDVDALAALVDHAVDRHYPDLAGADNLALALIGAVMRRQAALVARWIGVGFVHGVMNTDNTSISGETIDYGPCAFIDTYDPTTVFSSIDHSGRYAFGNQPRIVEWNMARLAEALLPVIDADPQRAVPAAQEAIDEFPELMRSAWLEIARAKLGLTTEGGDDGDLIVALLDVMRQGEADFTNTFRALCDAAVDPAGDDAVRAELSKPELYDPWADRWRARLAEDGGDPAERAARMRRANPAFIPRNHRVEEALAAAATGELGPFDTLSEILARPFDDQPERAEYREPAPPSALPYRTFCGT
jgi:uncharacterized protein YdiU (UPF0061 family)